MIDFDYPFKGTNEEPYVDIKEPDRRETIDSSTIDVNVTAYDDKPGLIVEVKLDDGDWKEMENTQGDGWEYTQDYEWVYTFTDVDEGDHTIYARATDSDGAEDIDSVLFTVGQEDGSKPPPTVTPGFEITLPISCLLSLFVYYKRRKG